MKVLLLGAEGMLGREILFHLVSQGIETFATCRGSKYLDRVDERKFNLVSSFNASNSGDVISLLDDVSPDVVINCIGVVKQYGSAISDEHYFFLNGSLPRIINAWCNINGRRLVHFSTDCVFTGLKGAYTLGDTPDAFDTYGLSKAIGEVSDVNSLTIRTSIVGIERESHRGLLSWFLSNPDRARLNGYENVYYSGLTTSYLAELVIKYYLDNSRTGLIQLGGPKITKFDLLTLANDVFGRQFQIDRCAKPVNDKSFVSQTAYKDIGARQPTWNELLIHLKNYSIDNDILGN